MINNRISCEVTIEGQIFQCPARITAGTLNGEPVYGGIIEWGNKPVEDIVTRVDNKMKENLGDYMNGLLPACAPNELGFCYRKGITIIEVKEEGVCFKLAKAGEGGALLFSFKRETAAGQQNSLLGEIINAAADFFGLQKLFFYGQSGKRYLLPQIKPEEINIDNVPELLKNSSFFVYTHFDFSGESIFIKSVRTLFGLTETDIFIGKGQEGIACVLTIPTVENSILKSENLYMVMVTGKNLKFGLKGEFTFSFLSAMTFKTDCMVSADGFEFEAIAVVKAPVPLFGPFKLGDTCLMIKTGRGLTFGMYVDLCIGKLKIFGAIMLENQGSVIQLDLLSAAFTDISILDLVDNLLMVNTTDKKDIRDKIDFIKILGLHFQEMELFDRNMIQQKDITGIVNHFNTQAKSKEFQLDASRVRLTSLQGGIELTDLKRMRHYYINSSGTIQLQAQFYYASTDTELGDYTIKKGIFICGILDLFGKKFEVLFSFNESEGLLAYAKIPEIDLKFLKIGPSSFNDKNPKQLPLEEHSILKQFINYEQDGMVFFLSARKNNISFYFDGGIDIVGLLQVDARIVFCNGSVSVDLQTEWLDILEIRLQLKVDYQKFTKGEFEFYLSIDTSKLKEKLTAVTQRIDTAIGKLREKIDNANREIDQAQAHVNELYRQIEDLDRKIANCCDAINHASLWKKAFVAIAKGIEIGAYEVAKAGVYAAIGVATAALEVARGALKLGGEVSEGVMQAVKGVIQGAMAIFYLNKIELRVDADSNKKCFQASISFTALGKTYNYDTEIGMDALEKSPDNALSDSINKELEPDLKNLESTASRSNWKKYRHESYTIEQNCSRLEEANSQMAASVHLLQYMQNAYIDEYHVVDGSFDEMNVSLRGALADAENIMAAGTCVGDVEKLSCAMDGLRDSVRDREEKGVYRDEELNQIKDVLSDYDQARILYDKVSDSMRAMQEQQELMKQHCNSIKTKGSEGDVVVEQTNMDADRLMNKIEEQMYKDFPVDRSGANFINLSREPLIRQCFEEAEKRRGAVPSDQILRMRDSSRKGNYKIRLQKMVENQ